MRSLISLFFLLLLAGTAPADDRPALRDENLLLKAELQLARTGKLYLLFDLRSRVVLIKGGGATIRRLPIRSGRIFGPVPAPRVHRLVAKKSLFPPKRPVVPIAREGEKKRQEVEFGDTVLELEDMPENFRLIMDDGTSLVVEPEQADWGEYFGLVWSGGWGWLRRLYQRFRSWGPGKGRSEVLLSMAGYDARRLYWSFDLDAPCLIKP